ncbi:MAG: ABC transporter ATP-binding protein [Deltaproteobacteria bacterium]|nr:ABC transporter ATP-binding protein [Deltaproteobacteria bacterium]
MLEVINLEVAYGAIRALSGISFTVPQGRIVALLGANGAGKSTTIRAIAGLVPVKSGRIVFQGEEIQGRPPHFINRRGIAVCPEGRRIFPNLTVLENLLLGGYGRKDKDSFRQDITGVFRIFPRLEERRHQRAGTLSGGEQQMLAIGRALMSRPRLLLLDEPSLGLAPLLVREVFHIIERLNQQGTTILLVEQNAFAALNIAHYAYILENGRLVLEGPGPELLADPHLREAYLGEGLDF